MKRLLVVCTGNICRSPMAEGLLKKTLDERGIGGVEVASAGTFALIGYPAEAMAQKVMEPFGVDLSEHRARSISPELIRWADCILVMTPQHRAEVEELVPEAGEKVRLLGAYGSWHDQERPIGDPYGRGGLQYRNCAVEIAEAVDGFVAQEGDGLGG